MNLESGTLSDAYTENSLTRKMIGTVKTSAAKLTRYKPEKKPNVEVTKILVAKRSRM